MALQKVTQVTGTAVHIPGTDIDTDRIIPARFMKCLTFDGLGEFAFYDARKNADGTDKSHPLNRSALAAYVRAGIDGPRKQRRVFQNRLQECFPCRALLAARRHQARLIEKFARENGWSATIHNMGLSVTFQRLASESQAAS